MFAIAHPSLADPSFTARLDAFAVDWLNWAWRGALVALLVLGALLVAWPLLRRRLSSHAASWLWLLPLVPLVAPPLPIVTSHDPLPLAPFQLERSAERPSLSPRAGAASSASESDARDDGSSSRTTTDDAVRGSDDRGAPASSSVVAPTARGAVGDAGASSDPAASSAAGPSALTWIVLAWLAVATLGALRVLRTLARAAVLVRRARPIRDRDLARRFDAEARQLGLERRVELREVAGLDAPATAGVLRSTVLLPAGLADELEPDALAWILRHELVHVRRRDVAVDLCVRLVRAIWFFHPAAWIAPRQAERARELACDEAALARRSDDGPRAASALLHVIERDRDHARIAIGAVPLTHPKSLERQRIMKLLDPTLRATRGLSTVTASGLTAAGALLLASGVHGAAPDADQDAEALANAPAVAAAPLVDETQEVVPAEARASRDAVVDDALAYLVSQQQEDGRWLASSSGGYAAGEFDDVGVTAVVLLALLDAPTESSVEGRLDALVAGVDWLGRQHDTESGAFILGDQSYYVVPSHALALEAWLTAYAVLDLPERETPWVDTARAAVRFLEDARNPYMGWRYDYPPTGDNDAVITSWVLSALASANDAGVEVPVEALRGGLGVLEEFTDEGSGRVGYNAKGAATSRLRHKADSFPGEVVELPTALAIRARLDWDADPVEGEGLLKSAALVASKPPRWSRGHGTIDTYYWHAGTVALQEFGGVMAERWNRALEGALLGHYDRDEEGRVFWAALDAWHDAGSEVAMTAWCVRALQAIR